MTENRAQWSASPRSINGEWWGRSVHTERCSLLPHKQVKSNCILGYRTYYAMEREKKLRIRQRILYEACYKMFKWQTKSKESRWVGMEQAWGSQGEGDKKGLSHTCKLLGSMLVWAHTWSLWVVLYCCQILFAPMLSVSALSLLRLCVNTSQLQTGLLDK